MFAQFFICPLLKEDSVDREMNAVDSEHQKNINSDIWRIQQLSRNLAIKDSPINQFHTGNKETLSIPNIYERLREFHNKYYSANIMGLAVLGREDVETLQQWVEEIFSSVPNKNIEKPSKLR